MGHNLDLCHILGLPKKTDCPTCKKPLDTNFDDYDIDSGNPILGDGKFALHIYCDKCDNEGTFEFSMTYTNRHVRPIPSP